MRTPREVVDWAHANPLNPSPIGGPSWDNDCVFFVFKSGGFPMGNSAATANLARAETIRHGHALDSTTAPPFGWFVYFDGPTRAGHIGMSVGGGKFLSATVYERDPSFGPCLGVMRISDYDAIAGVTYKGASPWFINQTLDLSSTAGDNGTPITEDEVDHMTARPYVVDGKTFHIMFDDGRSKPLVDYRTGLPMISDMVVALNQFLRYDIRYYPNGVRGAAVMSPEEAKQFSNALTPPASPVAGVPANVATKEDLAQLAKQLGIEINQIPTEVLNAEAERLKA